MTELSDFEQRAVQLARTGETTAALELVGWRLGVPPESAEARRGLVRILLKRKQARRAVAILRSALQLGETAELRRLLGDAFRLSNAESDAVSEYCRALELEPASVPCLEGLGAAYSELHRPKDAHRCYEQLVNLRPSRADYHVELGIALEQQGLLREAEHAHREAIRLAPKSGRAQNALGVALSGQRRFSEAVECYRRAIAIDSTMAQVFNNLGNALRSLDVLDEAIPCFDRALKLRPDYAEAYSNLGVALVQQGDLKAARALYERALFLRPDYVEGHVNLAICLLTQGRFAEGWREYEWRWQTRTMRSFRRPGPRWSGEPLQGRAILLYFEQGLGDTLQFIRYAWQLKRLGARVIAEVQEALVRLLAACGAIDEVVSEGKPLPPFDVHLPLLSLPGVFGARLGRIPAKAPYLSAPSVFVRQWSERFAPIKELRVGIAWQGNPEHRNDRARSIPLECFGPLASCRGVKLFSLQKGYGEEQLEALQDRWQMINLAPDIRDFCDAAAIMQNLDLVIACDSGPVHLAGALGVPVWVALPSASDWRWLEHREDSPWYPTMRLFRQTRRGDWTGVFTRIGRELQLEAEAKRSMTSRSASAPPARRAAVQADELRAGACNPPEISIVAGRRCEGVSELQDRLGSRVIAAARYRRPRRL